MRYGSTVGAAAGALTGNGDWCTAAALTGLTTTHLVFRDAQTVAMLNPRCSPYKTEQSADRTEMSYSAGFYVPKQPSCRGSPLVTSDLPIMAEKKHVHIAASCDARNDQRGSGSSP